VKITNEILDDYSAHCHQMLIDEFGSYNQKEYDPIYLYQRYKCRVITSNKRVTFESLELFIPDKYRGAYLVIKSDIERGNPLKKYQSRQLKNLDYDDDMLSHWGVQHFHLGGILDADGYISRTGELLFVHFTQTKAYILGIFSHDSWCDLDIIEVMHSNWPQELEMYKSDVISQRLTSKDHKVLRNKHANTNVTVNDGTEYFAPGMGVTANGAPINAVLNSDRLIFVLNSAFELIEKNISLILNSDPSKSKLEQLTIGLESLISSDSFVFNIKETGFKFTLSNENEHEH